MKTTSLSLDQAPPLSVPLGFFALAPLALIAAGALLISDDTALSNRFGPPTLAVVHLLTLGYLGSVMFGALYQMIPVVAGTPVPLVRLAHVVEVLLLGGLVALVVGFLTGALTPFVVALVLLGLALIGFVVPVAIALARAPTRSDTVHGMRLAVLGLVGVVVLGTLLAQGRAGGPVTGDWMGWLAVHVGLGFIVWMGGLIGAVSWQVVPMFYLAAEAPRWARRVILVAVTSALLLPPAALALGLSYPIILGCLLPGAVAVWVLHPIVTARRLLRRRRKRKDTSQRFWWAGLAVAPVALGLGSLAFLGADLRWSVLFGWVTLVGWAGLIVHGMLTRIIPFLVWFHRFSPLVGVRPDVPPMRRLWPDRRAQVGLGLHLAALALGAASILFGVPVLTRLAGAALVATGVVLGASLLAVLARRLPAS